MSQYLTTELTKAFLIYVPPHHEQYYRPFQLDITGHTVNEALRATRDGMDISPVSLAAISSQILSPSILPQTEVIIPNGMRSGRFAFFLEITTSYANGAATEREILTGFTNYDGVSPNTHAIDPDMQFHLNGRMVVRDGGMRVGPTGSTQSLNMKSDTQLLTSVGDCYGLRPEDIVGHGQSSSLLGDMNVQVIDSRSSLRGTAKSNNRENTMSNHYLNNICRGYFNGINSMSLDNPVDPVSTLYTETMDSVRAPSIVTSPFLNSMGLYSTEGSHTFTFSQLANRWPRKPEFWNVQMPRPGAAMQQMNITQNSEHWRGSNVETRIAYSLTQALPALLSRLMLLGVEVDMTNNTIDGKPSIVIMNHVPMFDGVVGPMHLQRLERQIEVDVMQSILSNLVGLFHIHLEVVSITKVIIDISIDLQPAIRFVAPLFCDSYYSPTITADPSLVGNMQNDLEILVDQLNNARCTLVGSDVHSIQDMKSDTPPAHDYYI